MSIDPVLETSWKTLLKDEFAQPYFQLLKDFLVAEIVHKKTIYPPPQRIFAALNETPVDTVKVVILGQDPYHGPGQAHGLSFSVPDGVPPPPSLQNMFKELHTDLGLPIPKSGNLEKWAKQGVLLLNSILTVRAGAPASHQGHGWEQFTDSIIAHLSQEKTGIVFLLWGKYAQEKGKVIDTGKHFVLQAAHPSPFSAHSGFFGSRHFSKTNEILKAQKKTEIDWALG